MKAKLLRCTLLQEQEAQVWSPRTYPYDTVTPWILQKSDLIHTGLKGKSNPLQAGIFLVFGEMQWFTKFYCDAVL